jgi:hypothetical protein
MGAEGKSRYLDDANKLATAYHEVGGRKAATKYALTCFGIGRACTCCPLYGRRDAAAQGDMFTAWSCAGLRMFVTYNKRLSSQSCPFSSDFVFAIE